MTLPEYDDTEHIGMEIGFTKEEARMFMTATEEE